ncbi:MAG: OOP family OmpA-OmpF porin [Granulosicoccus sp.]
MENKFTNGWLVATLVLICLSLAACANSPLRNAQLEQAKRQYEKASRNADIVMRGSDQLDLARDALEMAESSRLKTANTQVAHYVYLFEQHMRMAVLAVEQQAIQYQIDERAERLQRGSTMVSVVKTKDTVDVSESDNWELLLAAASATDAAVDDSMPTDESGDDDNGKKMTLGDVLFDVNRASLTEGSADMIENLVLFLNRNSDRMAVIKGHADNTGTTERNLSLSRNRAFGVQEALVKAGISPHRLAVRGVGESEPVASNELESGRSLNRRVDVELLE